MKIGNNLLSEKKILKSEYYLIRAKELLEEPTKNLNWESKIDWQLLQITIIHNLAILNKKKGEKEKAFELLKKLVSNINLNIFLKHASLALSGVENAYLNLAKLCLKMDYIEFGCALCKNMH